MLAQSQRDVILNREGVEQCRALEGNPNRAPDTLQFRRRTTGDVDPFDHHAARLRTLETQQVPQQGTLAGAAPTQ